MLAGPGTDSCQRLRVVLRHATSMWGPWQVSPSGENQQNIMICLFGTEFSLQSLKIVEIVKIVKIKKSQIPKRLQNGL